MLLVPTSRAAIFTGAAIVSPCRSGGSGLRSPFDPDRADENGLVAIGGSLDPELVLVAYRSGVFPWSSDPVISWWSPDPRAVFDLTTYKAHRSTRQSASRGNWRFSVDEAFERVMRECAAPAQGARVDLDLGRLRAHLQGAARARPRPLDRSVGRATSSSAGSTA